MLALGNAEEVANWVKGNVPKTDWDDLFLPMAAFMEDESPEQWLGFALSFSKEESREARMGTGHMLARVAKKSPEEAVRFFDRLGEDERRFAAGKMLSAWAERDVAGAIAWARQQSDVKQMKEMWATFLQECAASEPRLVCDVVREAQTKGEDPGDYYLSAVVATLLDVARTEGETALAMLSAEAARAAVGRWTEHNLEYDPAGTLALLKRWVPTSGRGEAVQAGFKSWLRSDQRAARAWAATVLDPELKKLLTIGEFSWRAQMDPAGALVMLDGRGEVPLEIAEEARGAFFSWTLEDAPAAAEWALKNPGLVEAGDVARLAENLVRRDEAVALYQATSEDQSGFAKAPSWSEPGVILAAGVLKTHLG